MSDLGGGKTTFTQGLAKGLEVKEKISSPTFVLEKIYKVPKKNYQLHHYDLYRIEPDDILVDDAKYKIILINRNVRSGEVTLNDYDKFVRGAKNISYVMVASAFKRGDYYCVSYARDEKIFTSPKIVAPQRALSNIFGYNEVPWYASADVYFITEKDKETILRMELFPNLGLHLGL